MGFSERGVTAAFPSSAAGPTPSLSSALSPSVRRPGRSGQHDAQNVGEYSHAKEPKAGLRPTFWSSA